MTFALDMVKDLGTDSRCVFLYLSPHLFASNQLVQDGITAPRINCRISMVVVDEVHLSMEQALTFCGEWQVVRDRLLCPLHTMQKPKGDKLWCPVIFMTAIVTRHLIYSYFPLCFDANLLENTLPITCEGLLHQQVHWHS